MVSSQLFVTCWFLRQRLKTPHPFLARLPTYCYFISTIMTQQYIVQAHCALPVLSNCLIKCHCLFTALYQHGVAETSSH